jgi:hypothetical protein
MRANPERTTISTGIVVGLTLLMGFFTGLRVSAQTDPNASVVKDLLGAGNSLGVDWARMFTAQGGLSDQLDGLGNPFSNGIPDFIDLYGGIDACALEDNISGGLALDMSALAGAVTLADSAIFRGQVASTHDLGNSYVYATYDSAGDLIVYVGIERLDHAEDTYIEVELNQDRVRVTTGSPWPIRGERTRGDLAVRINFIQGEISSVELKKWYRRSFETLATYGGLANSICNGEPTWALFCSGVPPIAAPQEVWDAAGDPVAPTSPSGFVEIGLNVGKFIASPVDYTSIQVRTPEDIALGNFVAIGYWAQ